MGKISARQIVGDEIITFVPPIEDSKDSRIGHSYNFYNYMYSQEQAILWLLEYLKRNDYSKTDIQLIKSAPLDQILFTSCCIARILNHGNSLPTEQRELLQRNIRKVLLYMKDVALSKEEKGTKVPKPSVQDRIKAQASELYGYEIDPVLDKMFHEHDYSFSLYDLLNEKDVTTQVTAHVQARCTELYKELFSALNGLDPDDIRGYSFLKDNELERATLFVKRLIDECEKWSKAKKGAKVRKPRKSSGRKTIETVSAMKYQLEDKDLKVVSVNPFKIVHSKAVFVYSTKKKVLYLYKTESPVGLNVRRSMIVEYDSSLSCGKKLRKPEEVITKVVNAGAVELRKIMDSIKAKPKKVTGRIKATDLILRVV